jgi:hypothetical protein
MNYDTIYFYILGFEMMKGGSDRVPSLNTTSSRRFRSFFGISADVFAALWKLLEPVDIKCITQTSFMDIVLLEKLSN